ncbi:MAG: sulfite exporter TauE/SafE family protein [Candidatus Aminicenantia bacterium]
MIAKGLLLGFSNGVVCLGYCLPVLFPLMFAKYQSSILLRTRIIVEFSLGRLIAYISFGAFIGWLGQTFNHPLVNKLSGIAILTLSLLLIFYGVITGWPKKCSFLKQIFPKKNLPAIIGFFTGFNICPPFLLATAYSFNLGNPIKGITFFIAFFMATSLYLIPFLFLSYFSKFENIRWIAQIFAIISGALFFFTGLSQIFN